MDLSRHTLDVTDPSSTDEVNPSADGQSKKHSSAPDGRVAADIQDNVSKDDECTEPKLLMPEAQPARPSSEESPVTGHLSPTTARLSDNDNTGAVLNTVVPIHSSSTCTTQTTTCDPEKERPPANDQKTVTDVFLSRQSDESQPSGSEQINQSEQVSAKQKPESISPGPVSVIVARSGSSAELVSTLTAVSEHAASHHILPPSQPKAAPVTVEVPKQSDHVPTQPAVEPTATIQVHHAAGDAPNKASTPVPIPSHQIQTPIQTETPVLSEPIITTSVPTSSQPPVHVVPVEAPVKLPTRAQSPLLAEPHISSQTPVLTKVPGPVLLPAPSPTDPLVQAPVSDPANATSQASACAQSPGHSLPDAAASPQAPTTAEALAPALAPVLGDPTDKGHVSATSHATPLVHDPGHVLAPALVDTISSVPTPSQAPIRAHGPGLAPTTIDCSDHDFAPLPAPTLSQAPEIAEATGPVQPPASVDSPGQARVSADVVAPSQAPTIAADPDLVKSPATIDTLVQEPAPVQDPPTTEAPFPVQDPPTAKTPTIVQGQADTVYQPRASDKTSVPDKEVDISIESVKSSNVESVTASVQEQIVTPVPHELPKNDLATDQQVEVSEIGLGPQKLMTESPKVKSARTDTQDSEDPKLPQDAPPSMDDESLETPVGKEVGRRHIINPMEVEPLTEEPMENEGSLDVPVTACSSEDNSKDAPPQDFKPFSNYTEDGKLIGNDEAKLAEKAVPTPPDTTMPVSGPGESSLDLMSIDDSFPAASDSLKSQQISMPIASPFQSQFMDFLKCNDNATQHSFTGGIANSGENSATGDGVTKDAVDPAQGEAMIGGEVTADGDVTTGSQAQDEGSQPATPTPRTGKKRGRKKKSEIVAQRLAEAAAGGETPKPARTLRKRKTKEPEKPKEGEQATGDETAVETGTNAKKKATTGTGISAIVPSIFPAEKLFEYQWPQDKAADWFFLQEHLSSFLGVKSFKRKYPDLTRRTVGMPERNFLQESGVVSEMQCDLGLTSLKSDQVYELLLKDFPEKYKQYAQVLREREHVRVAERKKLASELAKMNKNDLGDVVKRAVRSAAEFNAQFMREKREERRAYFDLQTNEIHYPQSTRKVLPPEFTKVGAYPVSLIPGQFQEHYKKYTPVQMKYFPLNTAMYDPPKHLNTIYADPNDKYESELDSQSASSQGEADDGSSSSGSSSGSGSDGESDSSSEAAEPEVVMPAPPPTKKQGRTPRGKKRQRVVEEEPAAVVKDSVFVCNICQGSNEKNKINESEELVKCAECGRHGHPSCLELTEEMIPNIKTYPWQCMECKTCVECMDPYDEDKMMFCDHCDRGYHTFCVGLRSIPTGRWECPSCRPEPPTKRRRRHNKRYEGGLDGDHTT